jgi:hypothetical protein
MKSDNISTSVSAFLTSYDVDKVQPCHSIYLYFISFYGWIRNLCIYILHFGLGYFHLLPTVSNAAMNICEWGSVWTTVFNSFGYVPKEVELLHHTEILYLIWEEPCGSYTTQHPLPECESSSLPFLTSTCYYLFSFQPPQLRWSCISTCFLCF